MTFLEAVNRLLRINTIIKGDDDDVTAFSDTQHAADLSLAQIAIQEEIADLASEISLPYEHTTNTISLVAGTRVYALQTNFTRFFGLPSFYDSTSNVRIFEYKGGETVLMQHDYQYKTATGSPMHFYWDNTTTKQVAFYNIPDSTWDGRSLAYDYEKSILVTNTTDTIPLHNNEEAYTFVTMAARRFMYMVERKQTGLLSEDATYNSAKSRLMSLLRHGNPDPHYRKHYC
jgi:hypothetical protein